MTDTTRPEWMPDLLDVQEQSDLHLGWADDEAMNFIYHVGLRAQIAVLEEIWNEMPSENFEEDEPLYRKDMVFLKIVALRKELEQ